MGKRTMTNDVLSSVSSVISSPDTPLSSFISVETMDSALRLATIQNRLELLITIILTAFLLACFGIVCYMFYRLLYRCI